MNRRAVSLILLLVLAVAAAALAARLLAPQRLSDARIARHFLAIAFGREHADGPGQHLAKWQGGIRYRVVRWAGGPDVAKAEAALHRQMRDLARLTGLPVAPATQFDANFIVALTGEDLFAWQVRRALAAANRRLGRRIADADGGVRSVFNDADRSTALSRLDRLFVSLLYHPRLAPGLSRTETARRVRQILPVLRRRMRY